MSEIKKPSTTGGRDTEIHDLVRVDFDEIRIVKVRGFSGVTKPVHCRIPGTSAATSTNYTTPFFRADRTYEVLSVTERHETLGTDGGSVTLMLKKVPSGTAPASGTDILTAGFDLKASINTDRSGTISDGRSLVGSNQVYRKRLDEGDSLCLVTTGTLTSVAGVSVSVLLRAL